MLGGKRARDARIHVGSSSGGLDNRSGKSKSSWSKYEWLKEVADYFNLNNWCFYCDFYARANYDSISIEASRSANGESVSYNTIYNEAKSFIQRAVNATRCPYEVEFNVDVF